MSPPDGLRVFWAANRPSKQALSRDAQPYGRALSAAPVYTENDSAAYRFLKLSERDK
jgi:hypothetical protein